MVPGWLGGSMLDSEEEEEEEWKRPVRAGVPSLAWVPPRSIHSIPPIQCCSDFRGGCSRSPNIRAGDVSQ